MSHIGGGRIATSSSNEQHHVNSRPPPSTRASLPLTSSAHHPEFCAGKAAVLTKTHSCHCPKAPLLEMTTQISNQDTPDPWMIKYNGTYMLTFTTGDRVEIWRSSLLHDFHDNVAAKRVVWRPQEANIQMSDIWAPELHIVNDYWWVYFCGANPSQGNPSHRMYALRGPHASTDPMEPTSRFTFEGLIRGIPDHWAIDGTVFHIDNQLYMVYSGWPLHLNNDLKQELFIAKMVDPITADPSTGVHMISTPEYGWEKYKDPGDGPWHEINEGPQWLQMGSFRGIVYSAGASWTSHYSLGLLEYTRGDPLQISSWRKHHIPLLCNNPGGKGPYAPGHCSFVPSPDNTQMWVVYHATPAPHDGWANRKAHCQPLELRCGLPYAGQHPLPEGRYPAPSGSFIPGQPTPLPETVMGPLPSRNDPDTKRMMEKGKKFWQSIKKGFS